jgi:two-component sensor histidine kinase
MKVIISYFICSFLVIINCFGQEYMQKYEDLYPAEDLFFEGKYDESIAFIDKALTSLKNEKSEKYFTALLVKSKSLIHKRQSQESLKLYKLIIDQAAKNGFDSIVVVTKLAMVPIYNFMGKEDTVKLIVDDVLRYPKLEGWQSSNCHLYLGNIYGSRNEKDSALYHFKMAVTIDRELADSSSFPTSALDLGSYYGDIDSQEMALKYLFEGYSYLKKGRDDFKETYFLDRLSEVYMDLGNYYKAEKYVDQNEILAKRLGMNKIRVESLLNKFEILMEKDELEEAKKILMVADSLAQNNWMITQVLFKKFYLDAEINGSFDQKMLQEILDLRNTNSDPRVLRYIDIIELKTKSIYWSEEKFLNRYDELYKIWNAETDINTKKSFLKAKVNYYEKNGNFKQAYVYRKDLDEIIEKQSKLNNKFLISHLETEFQTEKKIQEIEHLNIQNGANNQLIDAQRNRITIISIALLLITLLSFVLWRLHKKSNQQKLIIAKALGEKDLLLREIHHRVKNNLQLVSSLLTLQGRSITDVMAQKAIQEGKNRVMSMALIHQDLYNKESLTGIGIKEYIDKLTNELILAYSVDVDNISLELDIQDMELDVDTLVPIGLILNELITNSLKYAFDEGEKGKVSIKFKEEGDELNVTIADNGKGYKLDEVKSSSFGSVLVKSLVEQLEGTIIMDTSNGTRVEMRFKDYKIM